MSELTATVPSRVQRKNGAALVPVATPVDTIPVSQKAIAERAHEKFLTRGCVDGFDQEDWEEASRELAREAAEK